MKTSLSFILAFIISFVTTGSSNNATSGKKDLGKLLPGNRYANISRCIEQNSGKTGRCDDILCGGFKYLLPNY
ncbi:hypothetical protein NC796_26190 [Aliifodinibius sp. S!AR15-10]|uniref:hypothetical protein n=1 Tax=Aliifodinibius sp. S!AR15-10 TaxID=2950437 RepID=UPI00285871F0|nr:hypothetical protein [Aliifodinibius sp. S!AR15-10]MDR8394657.1 hypothetical protein [Aliifodinibius sp. S!AR15-10]